MVRTAAEGLPGARQRAMDAITALPPGPSSLRVGELLKLL